MHRQNMEDLQGSETTLYDTGRVHTCHFTFVQTHRIYNSKIELNPKENYRLRVILMCEFIFGKRCIILVIDVNTRGR